MKTWILILRSGRIDESMRAFRGGLTDSAIKETPFQDSSKAVQSIFRPEEMDIVVSGEKVLGTVEKRSHV